jgi:phosphoribosylformimino-5-aminoimidazole carboxamide ribotide isomerase
MDLLCAIDLRGGGAVRLLKGDYGRETNYGDPISLAESFIAGGSDWLHLVDLDAARDGGQANRDIVKQIASTSPIPVETGGGIRSERDVHELLDAGVQRVILGTAALESPSLLATVCDAHPGHVAVGLDYHRREGGLLEVAVRGWLEGAGLSLADALDRVLEEDVCALIVTAIDRDGTLEGPDLEGLLEVLERSRVPVVASGGVSGAEDLRVLRRLVEPATGRTPVGAVVGKALVEGRLTVAEAVAACG